MFKLTISHITTKIRECWYRDKSNYKIKFSIWKNSGEWTFIITSNEVVLYWIFTDTRAKAKQNWKEYLSVFLSDKLSKTGMYLLIQKCNFLKATVIHSVEKITFYKMPSNGNNIYTAKHTYVWNEGENIFFHSRNCAEDNFEDSNVYGRIIFMDFQELKRWRRGLDWSGLR
jgi:hypothetical protein